MSLVHRGYTHDHSQAWTAKAQEYCDQWPTPRNSEVVKRELEGVSNALKERERKLVGPVLVHVIILTLDY